MACHEIVNGDGAVIGHLCRPTGTTETVPNRRRKRFWCFKCRKHLLHTRMVFRHTQPSYYDDWYWWDCPQCHEENILFPGWAWEYDR